MKNLIDRDEILDILDERFGFWDFVNDLIGKHDLYEQEDAALIFAEDLLDGIQNVIKTTKTREERIETNCICSSFWYGDYKRYAYSCGECAGSIESFFDDEEFKFCPHCGARYKEIVKFD